METELEQILTSSYKAAMVSYLQTHPEVFPEAMQLALSNKQPYAWRAAWLLWSYLAPNDSRLKPYIPEIMDAIQQKNDGHQRELLKLLYMMDIGPEIEGALFDLCITIWEKVKSQPSARYYALKVILKISEKHPELASEVLLLVQDKHIDSLSHGIRHSIKLMTKHLHKR